MGAAAAAMAGPVEASASTRVVVAAAVVAAAAVSNAAALSTGAVTAPTSRLPASLLFTLHHPPCRLLHACGGLVSKGVCTRQGNDCNLRQGTAGQRQYGCGSASHAFVRY